MARWKKHLCINSHLNLLFLSLCVYIFKKCPSQFLIHWEPVFCSEELSCLPYKNQNQKNLIRSTLAGKLKFAAW